jgi:hydrogenase maturation protease
VTVLGLGNVLMRDDALGPTVVQTLLARYDFHPSVSVADLGTPGLELTPYIHGQDVLIVVDTVRADGAPGELRLYRRDELLRKPPPQRVSPHDPGLKEAILTADLHDEGPREVLVVGVIPGAVDYGIGLSEPVQTAVEPAIAAVLAELERLGYPATPVASGGEPDLWWEKTPD